MNKVCTFFCWIFILFFPVLCFGGCTLNSSLGGTPDVNVDMTPRMISSVAVNNFEEIAKRVTPAVVGISATYGKTESVGSGVALSKDGYILTNDHVVSGANKITVFYADKTYGTASLIWADPSMDLAVIKSTISMPYLPTGGSDVVSVGQDVIAIGTPLTLQFKQTITKGIVSALDRTIEVDNADGSTSYLQNLIQHDASINPGNSGGPLINVNGEVIGINTLKVVEAEGLGFAIPIEVAVPVLKQIEEKGSYETPYVGFFGLDSAIATFYGKTVEESGVYLVNIDANGPSAQAGLKNGDIIKKIDNDDIATMLDLKAKIYNYNVGDVINVIYTRNGVENSTQLTLASRT